MTTTHPQPRMRGPQMIMPPYYKGGPRWWLRAIAAIAMVLFCLIYGFFYALFTPFLLPLFTVPIFVAALFVIWALPEAKTAPTKTMVATFWAFTAATALWPKYIALNLDGLPWITLQRIISVPMITAMLICISVSQDARSRISNALKTTPWIWIGLVAFIIVQFVTMFFSNKIGDSVNKMVVAQTGWTAMFFLAVYVFSRPRSVTHLAYFMVISAVIASLIGVWEWRLGELPWAGRLPDFLTIEDKSVKILVAGVERYDVGELRIESVQTTPLGLGEYMALAMPFLLHFALGNFQRWVRIGAAASIPLVVFVVLLTQARLGLGGCGLALLLYVLVWALKRRREKPGDYIASLLAHAYPIMFSLAVVASVAIGPLREKVWGGSAQDASNQTRQVQWNIGLPIVAKQPWGFGIGRSGETLGYKAANGVLTIDTYYLLVLLDYGVIGFVVFYGLFGVGIYYGGRYSLTFNTKDRDYEWLPCVTIALINFVIIKSVFSQEDNHPIVFMLLGVVPALIYRMRKDGSDLTPKAKHPNLALIDAAAP